MYVKNSASRFPKVGIIMGSQSDLPVMKGAALILDQFNVPYELTIVSAHRTPERMVHYASTAAGRGIKVIIAGAGGSAHLPGMTASLTVLPVIGVPIQTSKLDGLDSLLSIVQMPEGIPVATVAINGAKNAALLALKILGAKDSGVLKQVNQYKAALKTKVLKTATHLKASGYKNYIKKYLSN